MRTREVLGHAVVFIYIIPENELFETNLLVNTPFIRQLNRQFLGPFHALPTLRPVNLRLNGMLNDSTKTKSRNVMVPFS